MFRAMSDEMKIIINELFSIIVTNKNKVYLKKIGSNMARETFDAIRYAPKKS